MLSAASSASFRGTYTLPGVIDRGLSHVPHVYLYVSSAMRNLPSDLEEAARAAAPIWRVFARRDLADDLPR